MAFTKLRTDYKDASWNGKRKYRITDDASGDGTKNIDDVTSYSQYEDSFYGAKDANSTNEALNYVMNALENGTNLYEDFKTYFDNQKSEFKKEADSVISATQSESDTQYEALVKYLDGLKTQGNNSVDSVRQNSSARYNELVDYINKLKSDGSASMKSTQDSFSSTMNEYERLQKESFDSWFANIKDKLGEDVATSLQNQITDLDDRLDRFAQMIVQNEYYAPLEVSDGEVLTDGTGAIFVADWHNATTENASDTVLSTN